MYNFLLTLNIFAVGFYLFVAVVVVVVLRFKTKKVKLPQPVFANFFRTLFYFRIAIVVAVAAAYYCHNNNTCRGRGVVDSFWSVCLICFDLNLKNTHTIYLLFYVHICVFVVLFLLCFYCNCRICTQEKFQYNCCAIAIARFTGRKRVRKNSYNRHNGTKKKHKYIRKYNKT